MTFVPQPQNTSKSYVADKAIEYNYDVANGPKNKKLTLLTLGRVAIQGMLYGDDRDNFILGWFPLPSQNLEEEAKRLAEIKIHKESHNEPSTNPAQI